MPNATARARTPPDSTVKRTCLPSPIGRGSSSRAAGTEQHRLGVGLAEGRQPLEVLGELGAQLAAGDDRVDARDRDEVLGRQHGGRMRLEGRAEGLDLARGDRAARRGAVAAVALKVARAGVQAAEQVEGGDRAAGAGAGLARRLRLGAGQRDHHRGPVVALGDPAGDDPDHARVPALAGEHVRGTIAELRGLRLGLEQDPLLGEAPLGVGGVELARDRVRAVSVLGEHQLDAGVGAVQAPGGVDPRRQPEADHPGVDP